MAKVSVIIPTYNRAKYLTEAMDSILNQTYRDFEIIVIDDGSTDTTKDILERYINKYPHRITYFFQKNKGVSIARNKGIREAKGEYIAFLDDDDLWLPEKLEVYMNYFHSNPNIALIGGRMGVIDENGRRLFDRLKPQTRPGNDVRSITENGTCATSSLMFRRDRVDNIFFDEGLYKLTDTDFCLRVSNKHKILNIDDILALYRDHRQNSLSNKIISYQNQIIFWRKVIAEYKDGIDQNYCSKRIARCYYLLGKEYFIQRDFRNSLDSLYSSICHDTLIGKGFWESGEFFISKFFKLVKPYGLILISLFFFLLRKR